MQYSHEDFMRRCLQLAQLGAGNVAPNPMVGAVLVYNDKIIGEGYHQNYGQEHAEVNCIQSVKKEDAHLIKDAVLYVSLEPCNHFGKTPPCTDLIIHNKIFKVIIGCQDNFTKVDGKGIQKLKENNTEVVVGVLEEECRKLNKRFFLFHSQKRPYIILKWAQTINNKISSDENKRLLISNYLSNKLVHKWRFEEAGILIGTNTALKDNPNLTNRLWSGKSPVRLVIDLGSKLPDKLNIFNNNAPTIIFNLIKSDSNIPEKLNYQTHYYKLKSITNLASHISEACFKLNIQSILVEGGQKTLQHFIDENLWDEARIITSVETFAERGLKSPVLLNKNLVNVFSLVNDFISIYRNNNFL